MKEDVNDNKDNKKNIKLFNTMRNDIKHIRSNKKYNKFVTQINQDDDNKNNDDYNKITRDELNSMCSDCL